MLFLAVGSNLAACDWFHPTAPPFDGCRGRSVALGEAGQSEDSEALARRPVAPSSVQSRAPACCRASNPFATLRNPSTGSANREAPQACSASILRKVCLVPDTARQ